MQTALVLFGAYGSMYPGFLTEARARGLAPLIVDIRHGRFDVQQRLFAEFDDHVLHLAEDIAICEELCETDVIQAVVGWNQSYNIVGVHSLREEFVEAVGVVGDLYGLPNPGLRATKVCRNKYLQRLMMVDISPRFRVLRGTADVQNALDGMSFPLVVKPLTSWASQGVRLVHDAADVSAAVSMDSESPVLLEERVLGQEVSVESLLSHGEIIWSEITVKSTNEETSDAFAEISHTVGTGLLPKSVEASVRTTNALVHSRLAFHNGISHAEYRVTDAGEVLLMEIAARNPGDAILDLYYLASGTRLEGAILDVVMGDRPELPELVRFARQVFLPQTEGRLVDIEISDQFGVQPNWFLSMGRREAPFLPWNVEAPARLCELLVERERGDRLRSIRNSYDRSAALILDAPTLTELTELGNSALLSTRLITEPEEG